MNLPFPYPGTIPALDLILQNSLPTITAAKAVKVFVIDPNKLRERLESRGLLKPAPNSNGTTTATATTTAAKPNSDAPLEPEKKKKKQRKKLVGPLKEKEETQELTFLNKEMTTKSGRLVKSNTLKKKTEKKKITPPIPIQPVKIRKRDPPEVFRCQTCLKVYLGYTKLNLHYERFPDHKPTSLPVSATVTSLPPPPLTFANNVPKGFGNSFKLAQESLISHQNVEIQTLPDRPSVSEVHVQTELLSPNSLPSGRDVDLVDDYQEDSVFMPPQPPSTLPQITVPLCLPSEISMDAPSVGEYCMDDFPDYHRLCPDSEDSLSLQNVFADTIKSIQNGTARLETPTPTKSSSDNDNSLDCSVLPLHSEVENSMGHNHSGGDRQGSISMGISAAIAGLSGSLSPSIIGNDSILTPSSSGPNRTIWQYVEDQIKTQGINQACGEISEMADKLSKVARDKFIPIREDELERLGNSVPVIQVDTPFFSHLLDLPFGTYIFKEDAGVRKVLAPPPPPSADLSLTGGVELDIDKFLQPDTENLPLLTNFDLASICPNSNSGS